MFQLLKFISSSDCILILYKDDNYSVLCSIFHALIVCKNLLKVHFLDFLIHFIHDNCNDTILFAQCCDPTFFQPAIGVDRHLN
jgi:hypothetical protein